MTIDTNTNINTNFIDLRSGEFQSEKNPDDLPTRSAGLGVASQNHGETPPANLMREMSDVGPEPIPFEEAMDSLYQLLGTIENGLASAEEEVLLVKLSKKMRDTNIEISKQTGELTKAQRLNASEEKRKIAEENQKKIEEAEEQSKKSKRWGIFKAIASFIAGVALLVAGACTGNPLLIAAGVCMTALAVNDMVAITTGTSLIGHICKAFGASEEQTQKWELAITIILTVVAIVCTGFAALGYGAPAAAAEGAAAVAEGAAASSNFVKLDQFAQLIGTLATFGEAAGVAGQSVTSYLSLQMQADVADNREDLELLQALMEALDKLIKEVTDDTAEALSAFVENIGNASEVLSEKGNALMRLGGNIGGKFSV